METAARIAVLSPQVILPGTAQTGFLSADFISEDRIVVYMESCAVCWDLATESRVWLTRLDQNDLMGDPCGASQSAVAPDGQSLVFVHTGSGQCTFYRLSTDTGEVTAVLTGETPARGAYHCCMALSPSGDRVALGFAECGFRTGEEEDEHAFLMLADFSGGCRTVAVEYTEVAALTFLSDDQLCVFTVDTIVAGYTHTDFDYAIACYDFREASPVWSTSGRAVIDRPVGDEATPTCSVQLWRQEFADGSAEELLVAQFAGRLLLLLPSDGSVLRTADFAADILSVDPYSAGQLYLALRDGRLMVYMPVTEVIGEMGSVTGVPRSAAYDRQAGAFLLALEDSRRTVVLSNQLEDPNDDLTSGYGLALGDGCFQVGGRYPRVYDFSADGRIARRLAVDYARVSPSGSEILCFYNSYGSGSVTQLIKDTAFRIYPMYTLDELVAKGQALLDGRTLTEAERIAYFIDG